MTNLTTEGQNGAGPSGNLTLLYYPDLCTLQTCDLTLASFLYVPTLPGNALYAGIFGAILVVQLVLGIRYKIWGYMAAMVIGLALECGGYVARIMIHNNPFDHNMFIIYLVLLTIAPAFLTAAIYLCLARIVTVYGEDLSRFRPGTYTIVFCTCDFVSLVLQGAGGGIASTANDKSGENLGKNLMLAGLIFQVFSLFLFGICCGEFAFRVFKSQGQHNQKHIRLTSSLLFKAFLVGLFTSSITIFTRCVYRCAELAGGFNSTLFTSDETLFMVLEGAMIVTATSVATVLHPGYCFQGAWQQVNFSFRKKGHGRLRSAVTTDEDSPLGGMEMADVGIGK